MSGGLDQPSCDVLLGGALVCPCIEADISLNNQLEAGTFRVVLPGTIDVWSFCIPEIASELSVTVRLSSSSGGSVPFSSVSLMTGTVDRISADPVSNFIELEGRDLSARLLDMQVSSGYVNQTASEIVASLAASAGLIPIIDPTVDIVGQYYQLEHARSALSAYSQFTTAWDLICHLAQTEQCECWVSGETLFFRPRGMSSTSVLDLDLFAMRAGVATAAPLTHLRFDRRVGLARGVGVSVSSWSSRQRAAVTATYPSDTGTNAATNFVFVAPNLPDDVALKRAQALYTDIVRHRQVMTATMPGSLSPMPRDNVVLTGSAGGFDGLYVVDNVSWRIDARSGFTQSFVAHLP